MLDFGWSELLVIAVVAILAIGPKQLPDVLYALGRFVRRLQYMRFALTKQFDDFMEQSDLHEMRKISDHVQDIKTSVQDEIDHDIPDGEEMSGQKDKKERHE